MINSRKGGAVDGKTENMQHQKRIRAMERRGQAVAGKEGKNAPQEYYVEYWEEKDEQIKDRMV